MSESLIFAHFLFFGERWEWIAHFALIKWVMWTNPSGRSEEMSDREGIAQVAHQKWVNEWIPCFFHFWAKNERFARKTDDWILSPVWGPLPNTCGPLMTLPNRGQDKPTTQPNLPIIKITYTRTHAAHYLTYKGSLPKPANLFCDFNFNRFFVTSKCPIQKSLLYINSFKKNNKKSPI